MTLAAMAEAHECYPPIMELPAFEELDVSSDGAVTSAEIQAHAAARLQNIIAKGHIQNVICASP
ncbi:MAG: hypothetical protein OSA51_00180 [Octadecabacter sp.]|nr:hypothetical protein [Octadecabacter sp.]